MIINTYATNLEIFPACNWFDDRCYHISTDNSWDFTLDENVQRVIDELMGHGIEFDDYDLGCTQSTAKENSWSNA